MTEQIAIEDGALGLAEVAQLYYEHDLTQEQIARRLRVSRSNVSRMLKEARQRGLVEIRIHHPLPVRPELARTMQVRYGLRDCFVIADPVVASEVEADAVIGERVGAVAARFLETCLGDEATVGIGWGNGVYHVTRSAYLRRRPSRVVVQVMGSIGGASPDLDGVQLCDRLARVFGGRVHYLHAPMVVTDSAVRDGLLRDHNIRRTLEAARRATAMVLSIGAISPRSGLYRAGYLNDGDLEYLRGNGVVGDLAGTYYDSEGAVVRLEIGDRMIAIDEASLRGVPLRLGICWGDAKAESLLGALRGGMITSLVTDEAAVHATLALDRAHDPGAVAAAR